MYRLSAKKIILSGIFIALIIIFTHIFAVQTVFLRIGIGFLPLAIYGAIAGPWYGAFIGAIADILGCLLFTPGFLFPGFTVSSFLSGYTYGYFFYNKRVTLKRICLCFIFLFIFINILLNTIWLSMLYHKAAALFLISRLIKEIICLPVDIFLFQLIYKVIDRYLQHDNFLHR